MKQAPQIIHADDLRDDWAMTTQLDGCCEIWTPARPLSCGSFFTRVKLAWGVFVGEYDALKWFKQ